MQDEVNLDVLNEKQRLKVFKAVQKDIKSKDIEVKVASLLKLKDLRYIAEGGCLPILLETLVPKKVREHAN
jgi:hypothetical protein